MASTYVNDLRLNEMATGDQSGSWGTVTNTNLELIAEAFSFGTEGITTNADTHTTTIADGATDPGRSMFLKYTGTLDSACTITIAPNTVSKLWFIENATSGSQNILISQGSGANITIPPGDTKAIYSDGAGSGAAMVDAFASLSVVDLKVQDDLTVTDDLIVGGDIDLEGGIDVNGTTNLDIVDIDGAVNMATTALVTGVLTTTAQVVQNGGFDSNDASTIIAADGASDNDWVLQVKNQEATDDRSFGLKIEAGSTATDTALLLKTHDSGTELFRVHGNGQALFVDGTAALPAITNIGDTDTGLYFPAAGKVGIVSQGTESIRFSTSGDIFIQDVGNLQTLTSGTSNLRIGANAGEAISTGDFNTLLGDGAGADIDSGLSNIAVGYRALYNEDGHGQNTAIGVGALQTLDAGADGQHVAIGNNAGTGLTDAVRNVIIGYNAASAATTPDDCVIIGWEAAHNAQLTGHDSVIIGKHAGFNLSSAGAVTIVGMEAGKFSSTGIDNTFIGYNAGYGNTSAHLTGADNTAVGARTGLLLQGSANGNSLFGSHCGDAITTGARNTALGFGALNSEVTGTRSTAVGYNALAVQNLSAESHNTSVGYNSSGALVDGDHNTIMGYGAFDDCDDGGNNVAIGSGTLSANCGDNNTAVGTSALAVNTGANQTAFGYQAGMRLTTGINSTFIGSLCGDHTVDGDGCTAVGRSALSGNCGDFNTAMGFDSNSLGTGVRNTAVGAFAMGEVANSGGTNTVMGYAAGYNLTSGSNNLLLGNDAGRSSTPGGAITTGSNTITLGDNSIATANIKVDWTVSSDQRDKTDFTALDIGLDFVKALNPVTYKWDQRSDYGDSEADNWSLSDQTPDGTHKKDWLDVGFKAQEVEALEQAAGYNKSNKTNLTVSLSSDGEQYGMKYSKFVPILVKAIQEQNALIEALTARVATLEG